MNRLIIVLSLLTVVYFDEAKAAERPRRDPPAGLLFYAKADYAEEYPAAVIGNPHICGALFQVIWSEVEKQKGVCDWSQLDKWIAPWIKANKKVAIRIMWSTSGRWPKPYYKTPTPAWVWKEGAKFAFQESSETEMPLIWDPTYKKHAWNFLQQFAQRYDANEHLLLIDVTPGAETNPYRFGPVSRINNDFKAEFAKVKASDGRSYDQALWQASVREWIDAANQMFTKTPLLVTLNVGTLEGPDRSVEIGSYCVERGIYVGQNGLGPGSYDGDSERKKSFLSWSPKSRLFFEMVTGSGGRSDRLMDTMRAAERIRCNYLNVYPEDVIRGTKGAPGYDPEYEKALAYGDAALQKLAATAADQPSAR